MTMIGFEYDDGGRADSGRRGMARDCVARALAIAHPLPYDTAYLLLSDAAAGYRGRGGKPHARSARDGIPTPIIRKVYAELGWAWHPTMTIGQGTKVHLNADELPGGRIIVRLSGHVCAVIDGIVHDTHLDDRPQPATIRRVGGVQTVTPPSERGTRAVYGYWTRDDVVERG